ncbi:MAG: hypothetical protein ACXAC5_00955 [Promethearchaeota archaeon]|jgi:hypothetical protein
MIEENMELPPSWFGMQIVVADTDGCIPEHEREVFCHFCSQDCLVEFAGSDEMRQRLVLADKSINPDESDELDEEQL